MGELTRYTRQRLYCALCGALLLALVAKLWLDEIDGWAVGLYAVCGFLLAWVVGVVVIEFLEWVLWWSW
jgi:hypothetical protein